MEICVQTRTFGGYLNSPFNGINCLWWNLALRTVFIRYWVFIRIICCLLPFDRLECKKTNYVIMLSMFVFVMKGFLIEMCLCHILRRCQKKLAPKIIIDIIVKSYLECSISNGTLYAYMSFIVGKRKMLKTFLFKIFIFILKIHMKSKYDRYIAEYSPLECLGHDKKLQVTVSVETLLVF